MENPMQPVLRVGGYVTYRKPGTPIRKALIEWINDDDTLRVRPINGRRTTITPQDIQRANTKQKDTA